MYSILLSLTVISLLEDNLQVYGSNYLEYRQSREERKEWFEDKFNLNVLFGDFLAGLQFHIFEPSEIMARTLTERVSKRFIEYRGKYFNIRVGNYYATLGRGLVLKTYEDDHIKLDQDLDGVKISAGLDKFDFTFLSGRPRVIFQHEVVNPLDDIIRGGGLTIRPIPSLSLGTNYARINRKDPIDPTRFKKTEIISGLVEASVLGADLYCEYARRTGWDELEYKIEPGNGMYFSLSYAILGFVGLTLEYKDYNKLGVGGPTYRYNIPPYCSKSGRSIDNARDERGYQIGLSMSPNDIILIESSYSNAKTHHELKEIGEFHTKVKLESYEKGLLALSFERINLTKIEPLIDNKTETPFMIESAYYINPQNSVGLILEYKPVTKDTISYRERSISLSYSRAQSFTVSLIARDTNERELKKTSWLVGELSWDITPNHNLRVRVGSEKGGSLCLGGVCIYEPPFEGVKVILSSRF